MTSITTAGSSAKYSTPVFVALNLAALSVIGFFAFRYNAETLFHGFDGAWTRLIDRQEMVWLDTRFPIGLDLFRGLGGGFILQNFPLSPTFRLTAELFGAEPQPVFAYILFSIELMLAVVLVARAYSFSWAEGVAGGWLLALQALPFVGMKWRILTNMNLSPHVAEIMFIACLIIWQFSWIGRRSFTRDLLLSAGVGAAVLSLMILNPISSTVYVPGTAALCIGTLWTAGSRREVVVKLVAGIVIGASLLFSCLSDLIVAMGRFNVVNYFSGELISFQISSDHVSLVYATTAFPGIRYFFAAYLIGCLFCLIAGGRPKCLAVTCLVAEIFIFVGGFTLISFFQGWRGPSTLYLEYGFWPAFAVLAGRTLVMAWSVIQKALSRAFPPGWKGRRWEMPVLLAVPALAVILTAAPNDNPMPYPPQSTEVSRLLKSEIGLTPGVDFRGRMVAMASAASAKKGGITWLDISTQAHNVYKESGNDHRFIGPWYDDVPTLNDYNQNLSPATHLLLTRFLQNPEDKQIRNLVVMSVPRWDLLEVLGVRFLVNDELVAGDLPPGVRLRSGPGGGSDKTVVYELEAANRGSWSPTEITTASTAAESLEFLHRNSSRLREAAVVFDPLPETLVPVRSATVIANRAGLRIVADSDATSMLLLPLEYSRCLDLHGGGDARLIAADLVLTGLVFRGHLDARLSGASGLFDKTRCRLEDLASFDRLRLREAGSEFFPGYFNTSRSR